MRWSAWWFYQLGTFIVLCIAQLVHLMHHHLASIFRSWVEHYCGRVLGLLDLLGRHVEFVHFSVRHYLSLEGIIKVQISLDWCLLAFIFIASVVVHAMCHLPDACHVFVVNVLSWEQLLLCPSDLAKSIRGITVRDKVDFCNTLERRGVWLATTFLLVMVVFIDRRYQIMYLIVVVNCLNIYLFIDSEVSSRGEFGLFLLGCVDYEGFIRYRAHRLATKLLHRCDLAEVRGVFRDLLTWVAFRE